MLAMGWNIERTKEGEAIFQQKESEKQRKISESQVISRYIIPTLCFIITQKDKSHECVLL